VVCCLFRHAAARGLRDLVVRVGQPTLVRRASPWLVNSISRRIGAVLAKCALGRGAPRWLPIVGGGLGVGAYAHHDTTQVAATAIGLYDGVVEGDVVLADDSPTA